LWGLREVTVHDNHESDVESLLAQAQSGQQQIFGKLLERGFAGGGRSGDNGEVERMLKDVLRPGLAALKSEVNKTLSYTASKTRGRIVDKIYVTGSLARYPGIEGFLGEHFTLPVEVLNPSSIFPRSLKGREMEHLWLHSGVVAATGLALRGVPQQWLAST